MSDLAIEGEYTWVEARDNGLHAGVHFEMDGETAEDFEEILRDSPVTWDIEVVGGEDDG